MSSQGDPACDDNDENNDDFDCPEEVLEPDAPFERGAVDEECGGDAGQADGALVPPGDFNLRGVKNVFSVCPKGILSAWQREEEADSSMSWWGFGSLGFRGSGVQG